MTNTLTGDYQAVVEVSASAINRVLATLHERGPAAKAAAATPGAKQIRLPHAFSIHVGRGPPKVAKSPAGKSATPVESPVLQPPDLTAFASTLHGMAEIQVSTPTLVLGAGTAKNVGVSCDVIVRYLADYGSALLPTYIRGRVELTLPVELAPLGKGTALHIDPGGSDVEIRFTPSAATPLSSDESQLVAHAIREILERSFQPGTIALPDSVHVAGIKKLGGPGAETIALPVGLGTGPTSAAGLDTVGTIFINPGDDLGVAVSRELIESMLEPTLDPIRKTTFSYTASLTVFLLKIKLVTYKVSVTGVNLEWKPGALEVVAKGEVTTSAIGFSDYDFTIRQRLVLGLYPKTNEVLILAEGLPEITGSLPKAGKEAARMAVIPKRDAALALAQAKLADLTSKLDLNVLLGAFGSPSPATAQWTSAGFDPAGVVLRGVLRMEPRAPAQVAFGPLPADQGYTAFDSWVPGGQVTRYTWWYSTPVFVGGTKKVVAVEQHETPVEDRFVYLEKIPPEASQLCLLVSGTQIPSKGGPAVETGGVATADVGAAGGTLCAVNHVSVFLPPLTTVPGWKLPVTVIDWGGPGPGPDPAPWIIAHVNAAPGGRPEDGSVNAVVHFAGDDAVAEIEALVDTIEVSAQNGTPVSLVVVLPAGFLQRSQGGLSDALANAPANGFVRLTLAEDYERTWEAAFAHQRAPETHLLNAHGHHAWRGDGPGDRAALTAALQQSLVPCVWGGSRLERLAIEAGDDAPDFVFAYADERRIPLRHLQGRPIELLFWKAWSTPCLQELAHKRERCRSEAGPVVLAIHDGDASNWDAAPSPDAGSNLLLVTDHAGVISRRYDVNCWPAIVGIDSLGVVRSLQLGLSPKAREWHMQRMAQPETRATNGGSATQS